MLRRSRARAPLHRRNVIAPPGSIGGSSSGELFSSDEGAIARAKAPAQERGAGWRIPVTSKSLFTGFTSRASLGAGGVRGFGMSDTPQEPRGVVAVNRPRLRRPSELRAEAWRQIKAGLSQLFSALA